jgi:hypothetical protein
MAHDFLAALNSSVVGTSIEKAAVAPDAAVSAMSQANENKLRAGDDRHRTVGVSMSPQLRNRAAQRAKTLGLPFSRYVQWCVEAELDGSKLSDRFNS